MSIKPPIAYRGDRVHAQPHKGVPRDGIIHTVELHFGWGDRRKAAYPVYAVIFDGHSRAQWIGEASIFAVYAAKPLPTPPSRGEGV